MRFSRVNKANREAIKKKGEGIYAKEIYLLSMDIINIFRYLFPFYCLKAAAAAADFFSSLGSFVFYKFCISVSRGCPDRHEREKNSSQRKLKTFNLFKW